MQIRAFAAMYNTRSHARDKNNDDSGNGSTEEELQLSRHISTSQNNEITSSKDSEMEDTNPVQESARERLQMMEGILFYDIEEPYDQSTMLEEVEEEHQEKTIMSQCEYDSSRPSLLSFTARSA